MIELFGIILSSISGTIGYFLYKFTNNNKLIGFLFSKNKSLFSYLKLGITPILLYSIVEKTKLINNDNVLAIKGFSILIFVLTYSLFYYLGKIIRKKEMPIYNISLLYISLFTSYTISFLLLNIIDLSLIIIITGYLFLLLTIFCYIYDKIAKPNYLIFKAPKQE